MKTPIQPLKSSKLYYNKWFFRVECWLGGASLVVRRGYNQTLKFCQSNKEAKNINKTKLLMFTNGIQPFLKNPNVQIRAEGSHLSLFCNELDILDQIESSLRPWIVSIFGPTTTEEMEFIKANGPKKVLCDKLPKNNFKYRIYFRSNWSLDKRKSFMSWADKSEDKIIISTTSKKWMAGERSWAQNPFAYVKDDKTLSMVGLQITGHVKKVEEFIERKQALVT